MNVQDQHARDLLRAAEDALLVAAARLEEAVVAIARSPLPPSSGTVARALGWGALIESSLRRLGTPTRHHVDTRARRAQHVDSDMV